MSSDDNILKSIIVFCKDKKLDSSRKNLCRNPTESDLYNWIESTSSIIIQNVIPKKFWKSHSIPEPTKLENFTEPLSCSTQYVLLLVLWSCWNEECLQSIVKCLEFGSIVWKSHHLMWVCSYAYCIVLNLRYSAFTLPHTTKLKFEGNLLPESICLTQIVYYSSCLYPIFRDIKTAKITVQELFVEEIIKQKIVPTLIHQIADVSCLTEKGSDKLNLISIADWFNRSHIVPQLQMMLNLKPIRVLLTELTDKLSTSESREDKLLNEIEEFAKEAADQLSIDHRGNSFTCATLVTFIMTAHQFTMKSNTKKFSSSAKKMSEKDVLLMRLFFGLLGNKVTSVNASAELKRIIEQKPSFFSLELTSEILMRKFNLSDSQWCSHLKFMISHEYKNGNEETFKPERVVEETKSKLHSNLSSSTKNKKRSLGETETKSKSYHIVTRSTGQNKKSKSLFTERKAEGKRISWGNISVAAKTNRKDSIDKCKSDHLVQRSCTL